MNITLDKTSLTVYVQSDYLKSENLKVIISDLDLDCTYYIAKYQNVNGPFSIWIIPFSKRLVDVVTDSPNFSGLTVKVIEDNTLIAFKKFDFKPTKKFNIKSFHTNQFDSNAASYADFFYGNICNNINFSDVVVDAGANVGFFTLYSKIMGANRIYSIEPAPEPFFYLQRNFSEDNNIICIDKAFNDTNNQIEFGICADASVASSEKFRADNAKIVKLETLTIKDILKIETTINLLKLDIEGSEFKVIENMDDSDFSKVNQLFIEFHDNSAPIYNTLKKQNYNIEYRECTMESNVGFIYAYR